MKNQRGEIATILTLISVGMMLAGLVVGNAAVQQTSKTQSKAALLCYKCDGSSCIPGQADESCSSELGDAYKQGSCSPTNPCGSAPPLAPPPETCSDWACKAILAGIPDSAPDNYLSHIGVNYYKGKGCQGPSYDVNNSELPKYCKENNASPPPAGSGWTTKNCSDLDQFKNNSKVNNKTVCFNNSEPAKLYKETLSAGCGGGRLSDDTLKDHCIIPYQCSNQFNGNKICKDVYTSEEITDKSKENKPLSYYDFFPQDTYCKSSVCAICKATGLAINIEGYSKDDQALKDYCGVTSAASSSTTEDPNCKYTSPDNCGICESSECQSCKTTDGKDGYKCPRETQLPTAKKKEGESCGNGAGVCGPAGSCVNDTVGLSASLECEGTLQCCKSSSAPIGTTGDANCPYKSPSECGKGNNSCKSDGSDCTPCTPKGGTQNSGFKCEKQVPSGEKTPGTGGTITSCGIMNNGQECKPQSGGGENFCYNQCLSWKPGYSQPVYCSGKDGFVTKPAQVDAACGPVVSPPALSSCPAGKKEGGVLNYCVQMQCDGVRDEWVEMDEVCIDGKIVLFPARETNKTCSESAPSCQDPKNKPKYDPPLAPTLRPKPASCNLYSECKNGTGYKVYKSSSNQYFRDQECRGISFGAAWDTCNTTQCEYNSGKCLNSCSSSSQQKDKMGCTTNYCCGDQISPTPASGTSSSGNTTTLTGGNCEYTFSPQEPESGKEFTVSVKNSKLSDADAVKVGLTSKKGNEQKVNTSAQSTKPWTFKETKEAGDWTFTFGWKNCDSSSCGNTCESVTKNIKTAGTTTGSASSSCTLTYSNALPEKCSDCLLQTKKAKDGMKVYDSYAKCDDTAKINYWCGVDNKECRDAMDASECKSNTNPPLKLCYSEDNKPFTFPKINIQAYSNEGYEAFIEGIKKGRYTALDASLYVLNASRVPGLQRLYCDPFKGQCDFYYQNPQAGT